MDVRRGSRRRGRWDAGSERASDEVPGVTGLQLLATGGNSTVYRAWQPDLDRWVAVKVLGVTLADGRARDRFLRECSAVGRLTGHPNIVTVLSSGVTRTGRPFLTMDLFERGSLADVVAAGGPITVEDALRYGVKLAGALATAHGSGILHRDLKPENVLLSRYGEPGLADFGIATLGEARGATEAFTATHAAPEVLDGRPATPQADLYGMGSTLWTVLTGRLPYGDGAEGPLKLMLRVLQQPLPPIGRPDVPVAAEEAVRWAMAKDPGARPLSALELGHRLQGVQAGLGLPVTELVVPADVEPPLWGQHSPSAPPPTIRPESGPPAADLLEPTIVRSRPDSVVSPPTPGTGGAPARSGRLATSIVAGSAVLALVLVGGAVAITRSRGGERLPTATTVRPPTPSSTGSTIRPATTTASSTNQPPTAVRAVTTSVGTIEVTWTRPAVTAGLIGYVVVRQAPSGGATARVPVGDPTATSATVSGASPGECFVVSAIYKDTGEATAVSSERACP